MKSWKRSLPAVRKAIAYIKKRGGAVSTKQMVAWDNRNGQELFDWDNEIAGDEWRLQQARLFLGKYATICDSLTGAKVKVFINQKGFADDKERQYVTAETILSDEERRQEQIRSIKSRIENLTRELTFWMKPEEKQEFLVTLRKILDV